MAKELRQTIRKALDRAATFDEFSALLLQEGVTVKESRGRLSYLTPDRTKPITARKLGDDFDRTAVLAFLEQNAARAAQRAASLPEYQADTSRRPHRTEPPKMIPRNYKNAAHPATSGKAAERSVANAENEPKTAA